MKRIALLTLLLVAGCSRQHHLIPVGSVKINDPRSLSQQEQDAVKAADAAFDPASGIHCHRPLIRTDGDRYSFQIECGEPEYHMLPEDMARFGYGPAAQSGGTK